MYRFETAKQRTQAAWDGGISVVFQLANRRDEISSERDRGAPRAVVFSGISKLDRRCDVCRMRRIRRIGEQGDSRAVELCNTTGILQSTPKYFHDLASAMW